MVDVVFYARRKVGRVFPALKHKSYRYYFSGQLISLIGTWLQTVTLGWLVFQMTQSPFLVGFITAIQFLPMLIFTVVGGVIADRVDKRKLLLTTQISFCILATTLGILTISGYANIWVIGFFAFLLGTVNAADTPGRQSFIIEMVGREHLYSAITLNISSFNSARVIGPAIAGFLIAAVGAGITFILNGISFLGPIIALSIMKVNPKVETKHHHPLLAMKIGFKYAYRHPIIRTFLIFTIIFSIFGFSYTTMLPVIAERVYNQTAFGLGILFSAAGLGAVVGTLFVAVFHNRFSPRKLLLIGSLMFAVSLLAFTITTNFYLALIVLFISGIGFASQLALINTTIQNNVENQLRGRVMSIFTTCLLGMQPLGNLQIGYLSEVIGSRPAIAIGASVVLVFAIYLYFTFNKLEDIEYSAIT